MRTRLSVEEETASEPWGPGVSAKTSQLRAHGGSDVGPT